MEKNFRDQIQYKVIANLDEQKYKSCDGMDPNLWPMLKDKIYTLNTWPTKEWAEWSAKSYREYQSSNLDINSIRIIEVEINE
jgi:hypothetical protein